MNLTPREEITPLTPQAFHVLLALAEKPMYGYGIVEQCRLDTEGTIDFLTRTVYRTLAQLCRLHLIQRTYQLPPEGSPNPKQYYALTDTGLMVLEGECHRYQSAAFLGKHRLARLAKHRTA